MKNKILIFILIAMTQGAFAQIQKGAGYFGGTLSGYLYNGDEPNGFYTSTSRNNYWDFNISYGHYLNDNFAIGLGVGFASSDYKNENTAPNYTSSNGQKSTLFLFTPFMRISKKISDNFFCFGNLNLLAGTGSSENTNSSTNNESTTVKGTQVNLGGGIAGGLNYFLNRHFAFSLSYGNLSYSNITTEYDDDTDENDKVTSDQLNLNLGLSSIVIGLQYFINNTPKK